jgi:serine/alanine adding enzyme
MIKLLSVNEIDILQWRQLVDQSNTSSFFQTNECYEFYKSLSFLNSFVFGVSEDGKLVGLICGYIVAEDGKIKRYFSRRAIIPGGILLAENTSNKAIKLLIEKTKRELSRKVIYIEIRNYNDYSKYRTIIEQSGFGYQPHLNFHVATPDITTALKNLNTTKRRQIKQTEKEGVKCYSTNEKTDLLAFYKLLENLYKTKVKTPLFPISFFEKLIQQPFAKLFVVKNKEVVLGGIICVMLQDKTVYEWFVCGEEYSDSKIYPSTLATWTAIAFSATHNFKRFDFMGAGKPDINYGVREFKSKFGGELVEYGRFLYICKPALFWIGKQMIKRIKLI